MAGLLDGEVRLVLMRFAFSNLKHVPSCLKQKPTKIQEEPAVKGEQFIESTEDIGAANFVADLKKAGYQLIDAYYQIRSKGGQQYAIVLFLFAQEEQATTSEEFKNMRPVAEQALFKMCEDAMWHVKTFLNPFFREGRMIDDAYVISVNLDARKPLVNGAGQPILQWQRDENEEKIGDSPIPLRPEIFLRIINGEIRIV